MEAAAPPAVGVRQPWEALPAALRGLAAERLGEEVVRAETQPGGFSPGIATRLHLADGRTAFVKAVSAEVNPVATSLHRREAQVAGALPRSAPVPRFRWCVDEDPWVVLAFDDVVAGGGARQPAVPWRDDELRRVLVALEAMAETLTPSPLDLGSAGEVHGASFHRWRGLAAGADPGPLDRRWLDHLDELADLESRWEDAAGGTTLLHLDLRADNLLLDAERVWVVDWPWAAVGAPWLDLVAMLPSVGLQEGPDPAAVWAGSSLSRGVEEEAVDCFLAAVTGYLVVGALDPAPPGLPTLRAFQGAQGRVAGAWLASRRRWPDLSR